MDKTADIMAKIYGIAAGWHQMIIDDAVEYTDDQMRFVAEIAIERIRKIIEDNGKL